MSNPRQKMKLILALLVLTAAISGFHLLKPNPSYAATSGTITGYVYWLDGSPVGKHATVYIDKNNAHINIVGPNTNSLYSVANLPLGTYQVYATYDANTSNTYNVTLTNDTPTVNQNITFNYNAPTQQIAINAGNNQTATVGTAVSTPPSVKVTNSYNNLVSGVSVTFAIASGNGSITNATQTTNSYGIATVGSWTLGTTAGTNTLTATATGASGSPVTFTATGTSSTGGGTTQTPSPTFSPTSTTFTDSVDVSLADTDSNATIYYTTDGTNVTTSSNKYSTPIHLTATTPLKAFATSSGKTDSGVANVTYTKSGGTAQTPTPTFSPTSTSFTDAVDVSLTDTDTNATIYYTTDGTNVTTSSNKYSTAIHLTTTTSLKAFATSSGKTDSTVTSTTYTKNTSSVSYTNLTLEVVSKLDNNFDIYGANVKISDATGGTIAANVTDSLGKLEFHMPNSQLYITISSIGWAPLATTLDLSSNASSTYQKTFMLEPASNNDFGQLALAIDTQDPLIKNTFYNGLWLLRINLLDDKGKEQGWCPGRYNQPLEYENCATLKAGNYSLQVDQPSVFQIDSPQKITIEAGKRNEVIVKISFPTQTNQVYFYLIAKDENGIRYATKYRFFDAQGKKIELDKSINDSSAIGLGRYAFRSDQIKIGDKMTIQAFLDGRSVKKNVVATQNNLVQFLFTLEKCTKNLKGITLQFSLCSEGDETDTIVFNPSNDDVSVISNINNQLKQLQTKYKTTDFLEKIILEPRPDVYAEANAKYKTIEIDLGMYEGFFQESLVIPSYLNGVVTHEFGHLYDRLSNSISSISKKPPWSGGTTAETNLFASINNTTKNLVIRDCNYVLPTMTCGQPSVEKVINRGGNPWSNEHELFASVFADVNGYPADLNAKVETISDPKQKSLVKKMIQTMQGY